MGCDTCGGGGEGGACGAVRAVAGAGEVSCGLFLVYLSFYFFDGFSDVPCFSSSFK